MKIVKIGSFFCSVFSRIWTECGDLLRKFPHSVQIWENTDKKTLFVWIFYTQGDLKLENIDMAVDYGFFFFLPTNFSSRLKTFNCVAALEDNNLTVLVQLILS